MKKLKYLLNVFLASALIFACVEEIENNIDFVETIQAPTNVSAMISITKYCNVQLNHNSLSWYQLASFGIGLKKKVYQHQ